MRKYQSPRISRSYVIAGIGAFVASFLSCSEPSCPSNTVEVNGLCKQLSELGGTNASEAGSAGTGASAESTQAVSEAGAGVSAGTAARGGAEPASSAGAGTSASPNTGAGGMSTMAQGGVAGSTAQEPAGTAGGAAQEPAGTGGTLGGAGSGGMSNPQPGCNPSSELCDNLDNDCDGKIDEGVTQMCGPNRVGICKPGTETCTAGSWGPCVGATLPAEESCDPENLDENCDGTSNEGCACTTGETRVCGDPDGTCKQGTQKCVDGAWSRDCDGDIEPKTEVCDQAGLDENCDGVSNEGCDCYNGQSERCQGNNNAPCSAGTRTCTNGKWGSCAGVKAPQTEKCDSLDNDCDMTTDEDSCTGGARCVGGRCVTCTSDSECQAMTNACKEGFCDGTSCKQRNKADHTNCTSGSTSGICRSGSCFNGCIDATDCDGGEQCVSGKCEVPVRCGDGMVTGDEACDASNTQWDKWSCSKDCKKRIYVYTPCTTGGVNDSECNGNICDASAGFCLTKCAGAVGPDTDPYRCTMESGESGLCVAGGCVMRCPDPGTQSICPLRATCKTTSDPSSKGSCGAR